MTLLLEFYAFIYICLNQLKICKYINDSDIFYDSCPSTEIKNYLFVSNDELQNCRAPSNVEWASESDLKTFVSSNCVAKATMTFPSHKWLLQFALAHSGTPVTVIVSPSRHFRRDVMESHGTYK